MEIVDLEIDPHIEDKIEIKHGVSFREVQEVCFSGRVHLRRGRLGLYKLFGRAHSGRFLFVVLADQGGDVWKVATARSMDDTERRLYLRQFGG